MLGPLWIEVSRSSSGASRYNELDKVAQPSPAFEVRFMIAPRSFGF